MMSRVLGGYETSKMTAVKTLLPNRGAFIDAGANKGDFSLLAGRILKGRAQVFAFEPEPSNCSWLRRSIRLNGYTNIDLFEIALSHENGEVPLYIGQKSGWHSLLPGLESQGKGVIYVKTRRLDSFLEEIQFKAQVGMIKIDVEGSEMNLLRGAAKTLADQDDIILLIDLHSSAGVRVDELCDYLRTFQFQIFEMTPPFDRPLKNCSNVAEILARKI